MPWAAAPRPPPPPGAEDPEAAACAAALCDGHGAVLAARRALRTLVDDGALDRKTKGALVDIAKALGDDGPSPFLGEMPAHDPDANHVQRAGVVRLLTLCEETIVSVREALSIHKQIEDEDESSRPTTPKTPDFATGLGKKPSPKDRIQATLHNTLDSTQLVRSAHATAVPPVRVVTEKMREREIVRDVRKREKKDREQNAIESRPVSRADEKSAATFVREGLDTQAVMDALRQANMLSKLKQGPRAPLGLAINQAIQSSSKSEQDKKSSVVVSKPHQLGISNPHLKITTRDMIKRRQPVSKNSPEPPGSADSS